jgi:hypothetical protein
MTLNSRESVDLLSAKLDMLIDRHLVNKSGGYRLKDVVSVLKALLISDALSDIADAIHLLASALEKCNTQQPLDESK